MGIGFCSRVRTSPRVGIALTLVTIPKLFIHDLRELAGLYRVGSLIGLALALGLVSFCYQKMMAADRGEKERNQGNVADGTIAETEIWD